MGKGSGDRAGALRAITAASASGGGNWITDGSYKFMVESLIFKSGHEGDCFIAELRVIESKAIMDGVKPNAVGTTCSVVCNMTKHASAAGNAKAICCGVLGGLGYAEEQVTFELMDQISGAKNPMRGVVLLDTTYRKNINSGANAGKPITLNKWTPITGQTLETIKAGREWLDKNAPVAQPSTPAPAPAAVASPTVAAPTVNPTPAPAGAVDGAPNPLAALLAGA